MKNFEIKKAAEYIRNHTQYTDIDWYPWGFQAIDPDYSGDTMWGVNVYRCGDVEEWHRGTSKGCFAVHEEPKTWEDYWAKEE